MGFPLLPFVYYFKLPDPSLGQRWCAGHLAGDHHLVPLSPCLPSHITYEAMCSLGTHDLPAGDPCYSWGSFPWSTQHGEFPPWSPHQSVSWAHCRILALKYTLLAGGGGGGGGLGYKQWWGGYVLAGGALAYLLPPPAQPHCTSHARTLYE